MPTLEWLKSIGRLIKMPDYTGHEKQIALYKLILGISNR
ncbi:MAG: hypothetical protein OFPI_42090 [Osedax symbiont Rs2]|nr:MAG: hypothetical protein OFPI_42090 [Osedax symbiont Rs2]